MQHYDQWMMIFDAAVSLAVILQMLILLGLLISVRKAAAQMTALSEEVRDKALPALEAATSLLKDSRPKIDVILEHASKTTEMARLNMARLDDSMGDLIDRARRQIIRTDDLVSRTLTKVEQTSDLVQHTIVSPVRRISAIMEGLIAAVDHFMGRSTRSRNVVPKDDLFI